MLRVSPQHHGLERSTWTVELIRQVILPELKSYSGAYKRLARWQISRKQARLHICSPDPLYQTKKEAVERALAHARDHSDTHRLLYADEASFYRLPSLTRCLRPRNDRPLAQWAGGFATRFRICASLDAVTGEIVPVYRNKFDTVGLCTWLAAVRNHYADDIQITIAWDNWPIHEHPDVLRKAQDLNITFLLLPTYAPWTNPIEKLWRLLRQELAHMHEYITKERWPQFKTNVINYLNRYTRPSSYLLHYVGLQPKCTD